MADGQLATVEERGGSVTAPGMGSADAFIAMIERAAVNPAVDVDKIERLYTLHERMQAKAAETAFYAAMAQLQPQLPVVEHTKKISYEKGGQTIVKGTYTPWEDIDELIRPLYTSLGFSLSFDIEQTDAGISVETIIMHREGHSVRRAKMRLPPDPSGNKGAAQAVGSAVSYAKRYSACAALNITTRGANGESEDDDGEKAHTPMNASQAKQHGLWERLETELKNECATQIEADAWWEKVRSFREAYRDMPDHWKRMFRDEVFLPYRERLKPGEP
jgi:hypothetical protein